MSSRSSYGARTSQLKSQQQQQQQQQERSVGAQPPSQSCISLTNNATITTTAAAAAAPSSTSSVMSTLMKKNIHVIRGALLMILVVEFLVNVLLLITLQDHAYSSHVSENKFHNLNPILGNSNSPGRMEVSRNSTFSRITSTFHKGGLEWNVTQQLPTISQQQQQQQPTISQQQRQESSNIYHSKHRILTIFQQAGLNLTQDELDDLPTWEEIEQVVGKTGGPIIYNMPSSCSAFTSIIPAVERNIGCSGMFNSGTNLVTKLLKANCVIPERVEKYGTDGPFYDKQGKKIGPGEAYGIRWQVPWGKHMPANYREEHAAKYAKAVWKESVLAVVTIRHPYAWFVSMCKNSYTAKWPHDGSPPDGTTRSSGRHRRRSSTTTCPNLREHTTTTTTSATSRGPLIPVQVTYDGQETHHASLAHLWNDWYGQYLKHATFPFIVVRFEDLQFYAQNVTEQICHCAGGVLRSDRPFQFIVDSAKDGPGHGKLEERTGMLAAWKKYGKPMPPQNGFSNLDYETALESLDSEMMGLFGYQHPERVQQE